MAERKTEGLDREKGVRGGVVGLQYDGGGWR